MAERRMFHTSVVESDAFLDLPVGAQALYFHIGMHADDDGFVNGPRQIMRKMGGGQEDLEALYGAGFLLDFDGIAVVKHWRMANSMQNDRVKPLRYPEIARKLYLRENRSYTAKAERGAVNLVTFRKRYLESGRNPDGIQVESSRNPDGIQSDSSWIPKGKEKKGKEKKGKEMKLNEPNINESKAEEPNGIPPEADVAAGEGIVYDAEHKEKILKLTPGQVSDLIGRIGLASFNHYALRLSKFIVENDACVKDHHGTILKWWEEDHG